MPTTKRKAFLSTLLTSRPESNTLSTANNTMTMHTFDDGCVLGGSYEYCAVYRCMCTLLRFLDNEQVRSFIMHNAYKGSGPILFSHSYQAVSHELKKTRSTA